MARFVRIIHRPSGTLIAEGKLGWPITPFEGNYSIGRRALRATVTVTDVPLAP